MRSWQNAFELAFFIWVSVSCLSKLLLSFKISTLEIFNLSNMLITLTPLSLFLYYCLLLPDTVWNKFLLPRTQIIYNHKGGDSVMTFYNLLLFFFWHVDLAGIIFSNHLWQFGLLIPQGGSPSVLQLRYSPPLCTSGTGKLHLDIDHWCVKKC